MNISDENKVPVDLIAKYLNGEADTDDIIDLEKWKSQSGDNRKKFDEYRTIWEKTGQLSLFADIDIENEWNVFLENVDFREEKYEIRTRKISWQPLIKIAAVFLISLAFSFGGYYIYHNLKYEKLIAKNEVLEVNLPDGSTATLNKGSKLFYPANFASNRHLRLNGEAFFEVKEDAGNPFTVKSGDVTAEVVGTAFNFYAYKNEEVVQLIVESGKVAVYDKDDALSEKDVLVRGEKLIYSRESGIRSIMPNADKNYKSWKTGVLNFNNSTLQYIIGLLEKQFQTEITLVNPLLNQCRITVSFDNQDLNYILETITETLDLKLLKSENGYFIDGPEC